MTKDHLGRSISYLRISVTDRCNFRCIYCMPEEGVCLMDHEEILSFEEIVRLTTIATEYGIKHLRLTGGEPLVRPGIVDLVRMLKEIPGIEDIALTTNAVLLPKLGPGLKEAGLDRVNISLDTLDPAEFERITRTGKLESTLAGIDTALELGFHPVKINAVVVRSLEQDLIGFAGMSREKPLHIRFIEYMPVGESSGTDDHGWTAADTIPNDELIERLTAEGEERGWGTLAPLSQDRQPAGWGPATYYAFPDAQGTVGFISAMSNHFCASCNRLRLTADGGLRPCLFSDLEFPARTALREGSEDEVRALFQKALRLKPDAHHNREGTERRMSQIGG